MTIQKNKGFTLLELLLVIGITTSMAIVSFQDKMLETEQYQARKLGMELFQYNSAVQNYLAHQSGNPNPKSLEKTHIGVKWLKSTSCGGESDKEWLSCNFLGYTNGKTSFGRLSFSTTIVYENNNVLTARTVMSKLNVGTAGKNQERADLSGLAAMVASGAYAVSEDGRAASAQDSTIVYCPDTSIPTASTAACQGEKGVIVMIGRNQSSSDRWLRVDHGNVMQNALEFRTGDSTPSTQSELSAIDGFNRQIRNVARIYNLGDSNSNSSSDNLYLGKKYGNAAKSMATLANNAVIVDADQEILGRLVVSSSIQAKGNISTEKDISAKGNISSDGKITANQDIESKKNIYANGNLISAGDANIGNTLNVTKDAAINGAATINGIVTAKSKMAVGDDATFNGNIFGKKSIFVEQNGTFNGVVSTQRLVDTNNNAYYVDPSDTSRLNGLNANYLKSYGDISADGSIYANGNMSANGNVSSGNITSGKYILPNQVVGVNSSCAGLPSGTIAKSPQGEILSCQSGIWAGSKSDMQTLSGTSSISGLTPYKKYLVTVYGITDDKGERGAWLGPVKVTNSSGGVIDATSSLDINWMDGNTPQSAVFIINAPSNGVIYGYTDNDNAALNMKAVSLN